FTRWRSKRALAPIENLHYDADWSPISLLHYREFSRCPMQVTPHVYVMHINDDSVYHPGGSNNYFVGDPREEMLLIDTGDQQREWTRSILDYYTHLGRPKISAILLTHSHQDHIGGVDRIYDVVQAPVRCHPKLVKKLASMVGPEAVVPLKSREMVRTGGDVAGEDRLAPRPRGGLRGGSPPREPLSVSASWL